MKRNTLVDFLVRGALTAAGFALLSLAAAHAHLQTGNPGDHSVVTAATAQFTLEFTEDVETGFSRFELYALSSEQLPAAADAPDSTVWAALGDEAKALSEAVLAAQPGHQDFPLKVVTQGAAAEVDLELLSDLPPGNYVLVFKVVSADTHTSSGYLVFSYQPAE